MLFRTGPRMESGTIVVEPSDYQYSTQGHRIGATKGLRVKFKRHLIDTDAIAKAKKWTEDQLALVNDHILDLVENNVGRADKRWIELETIPVGDPAAAVVDTCKVFWIEPGTGNTTVCGNRLVDGKCAKHSEASAETPAPAPEPAPAEAEPTEEAQPEATSEPAAVGA